MYRSTGPFQIRRRRWPAAMVLALLFGTLAGAFATPLAGRDLEMDGDRSHARIVMSFDGEPDPRFLLLRGPHRLVVDLPETRLTIEPGDLKASGLIKGVR